jgi:hypothetical protein
MDLVIPPWRYDVKMCEITDFKDCTNIASDNNKRKIVQNMYIKASTNRVKNNSMLYIVSLTPNKWIDDIDDAMNQVLSWCESPEPPIKCGEVQGQVIFVE